jgi:hypothetical protein
VVFKQEVKKPASSAEHRSRASGVLGVGGLVKAGEVGFEVGEGQDVFEVDGGETGGGEAWAGGMSGLRRPCRHLGSDAIGGNGLAGAGHEGSFRFEL